MMRWLWFGRPGHFVCAYRCVFHLHTHIGHYCISTVGDMRPSARMSDETAREEVGCDRLYETMAFDMSGREETNRWEELVCDGYNDAVAADAGHIAVCERMDAKLDPDCRCDYCQRKGRDEP